MEKSEEKKHQDQQLDNDDLDDLLDECGKDLDKKLNLNGPSSALPPFTSVASDLKSSEDIDFSKMPLDAD